MAPAWTREVEETSEQNAAVAGHSHAGDVAEDSQALETFVDAAADGWWAAHCLRTGSTT